MASGKLQWFPLHPEDPSAKNYGIKESSKSSKSKKTIRTLETNY